MLPMKRGSTGPPVKRRIERAERGEEGCASDRLLVEEVGRSALVIATMSSAEMATTMKATAEPAPKSTSRSSPPDLEREQRRGRAGAAAGHRIDEVIAGEGDKRVIDEEDDDDRLDLREDHLEEAVAGPLAPSTVAASRLGLSGKV